MKGNKKGTDAATPMPGIEKEASMSKNMNQNNSTTASNMCLLLISAFLILAWIGTISGNEAITLIGLGLGASGGLIQARLNIKEDR